MGKPGAVRPVLSEGRVDESAERTLIERFRRGDTSAFDELMRAHYEQVYAVAFRSAGSAEEAHSLAQEVFVQAYQSLARFDGRARLATWLHAITVNKGIDRQRSRVARRKLGEGIELPETSSDGRGRSADDPARLCEASELGDAVREALPRLPPDQRVTLELVTYGGVSYEEAATTLKCTKQTIAWRVWNARRLLREMLRAYLE